MARRVFHADAELASQCWEAVGFLVALIREIRDPAVKRDTAGDTVRCPKVDPRVTGIHDLARKVIVGARTGEIAVEVPVHSPEGSIEHDISGILRAAQQRATDQIIRIDVQGIAGSGKSSRGLVSVIRGRAEPVRQARFAGQDSAASASQIGVEESPAKSHGIQLKADDVMKTAFKVGRRETHSIRSEFLLDAGM